MEYSHRSVMLRIHSPISDRNWTRVWPFNTCSKVAPCDKAVTRIFFGGVTLSLSAVGAKIEVP